MASAQSDTHNRAIHHLEDYEDCSLPTQDECTDALEDYHGDDIIHIPYNYTQINSLLDTLCSEACIDILRDNKTERDDVCLKQNNQYCFAIEIVREHLCKTLSDMCTDDTSYCLDFFANDFSCCLIKRGKIGDATKTDLCGNPYICSNSTCVPNSTCVGANCTAADPITDPTKDPSPTIEPAIGRMVSVSTTVTVAVVVAIVAAALPLIVMAVIVFIRQTLRKHTT